jgi:N-acylglucosamine-6-phosphate 2-epimerase
MHLNIMHTEFAQFRTTEKLDTALRGGLVVSCQPVDHGPMDRDDVVAALAQAAIAGGANGIRIENARRLAVVRHAVKASAPIIGIVKYDLADSPVRITPFVQDVIDLANAGADVIAIDGTHRVRPTSRQTLLSAIREHGALAMADCSTLDDAMACHEMGFDIVGTTLSGYTGGQTPTEPDYDFLQALAKCCPRVMAEGRFNTPEQCQRAVQLGAWAVTVGTAITRTEVVTGWFSKAVHGR